MVIQRLILQSAKREKLASFYSDTLHLPVEHTDKNIRIGAGISELVVEDALPGTFPFYHFAFTIPSNKIEEAREWLKPRVDLLWLEDYKSEVADFINWQAKSVYFFDPAGNIVEFIARFDLNNATEAPFDSKQILSISETGLVFPGEKLDEKTQELIEQFGLSYFNKQPPLPQFKALGNDEGLFIIVPSQRNWYPTDRPSGIFPMEIEFSNDGQDYQWRNG